MRVNVITFKKATVVSLLIELCALVAYSALEPAFIQAASATDVILVNQTVTAGISITSPSDVTLTALTTSQNNAVASTTWTVTTNNATGYSLTVAADQAPAMRKGLTSTYFADYNGALNPWTVTNAFQFGFSAIGSNTTGYGSDPQNNCAAGTDVQSTTLNWKGFNGVTGIEIASSTATTTTSGVTTTFCVGTEQDSVFAPSGSYVATTTATATTNP